MNAINWKILLLLFAVIGGPLALVIGIHETLYIAAGIWMFLAFCFLVDEVQE